MADSPLQQAIQQVGNQIVAQMKANLQRNNNDNTGRLANSITATVEGTSLIFEMEQYGEWVNDGAERGPGRVPPIRAIERWIVKNGITPKQGITRKQLPFVIAKGIAKRGQTRRKAFPFIEPAIETVLKQDLGGLFGKAIDQLTKQFFNPTMSRRQFLTGGLSN
jgi:hypothetical protein